MIVRNRMVRQAPVSAGPTGLIDNFDENAGFLHTRVADGGVYTWTGISGTTDGAEISDSGNLLNRNSLATGTWTYENYEVDYYGGHLNHKQEYIARCRNDGGKQGFIGAYFARSTDGLLWWRTELNYDDGATVDFAIRSNEGAGSYVVDAFTRTIGAGDGPLADDDITVEATLTSTQITVDYTFRKTDPITVQRSVAIPAFWQSRDGVDPAGIRIGLRNFNSGTRILNHYRQYKP